MLKKRHNTRECRSEINCKKCSKRHNTIVHLEFTKNTGGSDISTTSHESSTLSSLAACSVTSQRKQVLLATALVYIKDKDGNSHECRALLDSASQSNFVTEDFCNRLNLSTSPIKINISGIGQEESRITKRTNIMINSKINSITANLSCLVLPSITTNVPSISFDINSLNIPDDLRLADPEFFESSQVDLLIGASLFWDVLCHGQIRLGSNLPTLQKTHLVKTLDLNEQMQKFWEIEKQYVKPKVSNP